MKAACSGVRGAGEEEGGGVVARTGRRDENPALVLLGLILIGDEGEAELLPEPGDRLVIRERCGRYGRGIGALVSSCRKKSRARSRKKT